MLKKRLPTLAEILPVLALTAVMFYGWSLVVFLWKLPGYLFFLVPGEIAIIFSVELVTNLIETLLVMALILLAAGLLPARVLKDEFIIRAAAVALVLVGSMMLVNYLGVINRLGSPAYWPVWLLGASTLGVALAWVASRVRILGRALAWLGDRLIVFLLILMPLSAIGLVVVLARFIF